jgi:hypothetical protein
MEATRKMDAMCIQLTWKPVPSVRLRMTNQFAQSLQRFLVVVTCMCTYMLLGFSIVSETDIYAVLQANLSLVFDWFHKDAKILSVPYSASTQFGCCL